MLLIAGADPDGTRAALAAVVDDLDDAEIEAVTTSAEPEPLDDYTVAIPAFLTIVLMPFTYSITNGIGAGVIAFVLLRTVAGRVREISPLLWVVAAFFLAYFCLNPIESALGIS